MNPFPRRWITILIPPLVLLLLTMVVWQLAVTLLEIKPYLLPSPTAVVEAAIEHRGELFSAIWLTGRAAGLGLLVSILLGTATALVFSQSRIVRRSFYPYAIALQTVPIVAVAPLITPSLSPAMNNVGTSITAPVRCSVISQLR